MFCALILFILPTRPTISLFTLQHEHKCLSPLWFENVYNSLTLRICSCHYITLPWCVLRVLHVFLPHPEEFMSDTAADEGVEATTEIVSY